MIVKTPIFLVYQYNASYRQTGSTFLYLNKSKPLQLISSTVMNDSIVIELNTPILVSFYIFHCFLDILVNFISRDVFWCVPPLIHFIFILYVIVQIVYMCIRMNKKQKNIYWSITVKIRVKNKLKPIAYCQYSSKNMYKFYYWYSFKIL